MSIKINLKAMDDIDEPMMAEFNGIDLDDVHHSLQKSPDDVLISSAYGHIELTLSQLFSGDPRILERIREVVGKPE